MASQDYETRARELSLADFVARYTHPFLVVEHVGNDDDGLGFRTELVERRDGVATDRPLPMRHRPDVHAIVKSTRNPYNDRISVGRAPSCDIILLSSSLSKVHAHFLRCDDGTWELRDAQSRNGTFRNGERLQLDARVRVQFEDRLAFGSIQTQFSDAAAVHRLLRTSVLGRYG